MIEKKEVKNIAKLARIDFNEEEIEKLRKDLSVILEYFKLLDEVDVSNVPSFFNSSFYKENFKDLNINKGEMLSSLGFARKDVALENKDQNLIDSAPDKKDNYLKVKEVF